MTLTGRRSNGGKWAYNAGVNTIIRPASPSTSRMGQYFRSLQMNTQLFKPQSNLLSLALLALLAVLVAAPVSSAEEMIKGYHAINVDPSLKGKVSKEAVADLEKFFHDAEMAIGAGDLDKLMELYSDNYKNEDHDKEAARKIWARIFGVFNDMASMHNMKLLNYSAEGKLAVIGCSGILLGKKKDGATAERMPIDTWTNEEHILTLENGRWKLIGSSGLKRKRLWFDKPMHPLF